MKTYEAQSLSFIAIGWLLLLCGAMIPARPENLPGILLACSFGAGANFMGVVVWIEGKIKARRKKK